MHVTQSHLVMLPWCAALLLLSACFRSGSSEDAGAGDGTITPDGSTMDGEDARDPNCDYLGSHQRCDEVCFRCPRDHQGCNGLPFCYRSFDPMGRIGNHCNVSLTGTREGTGRYCYTGELCVTGARESSWDERVTGSCVDEVVCQQLHLEPGHEFRQCRYSDGTTYDQGPPWPDICPMLPDGSTGEHSFCGGACGECFARHPGFLIAGDEVGCIGINEERGFGVCAMVGDSAFQGCGPDFDDALFGMTYDFNDIYREPILRRSTCMRELVDGVPRPRGWIVWEDACEGYTARFPGQFECSRNPR